MNIQKTLDYVSLITKRLLIVLVVCCVVTSILHTRKAGEYAKNSVLYRDAVANKDGEKAVEFAKKLRDHAHFKDVSQETLLLAGAYELSGNYDEALKLYEECWGEERPRATANGWALAFARARIAFKRGNREEGFKLFCQESDVEEWKSSHGFAGKPNSEELLLRRRADYREAVTLENDRRFMFLTSFREYGEFVKYIEETSAALGEPAEYDSAVSFIREIADVGDEIETFWQREYGAERLAEIKKSREQLRNDD